MIKSHSHFVRFSNDYSLHHENKWREKPGINQSTNFIFISHPHASCSSHYPEIPWVSLTLLPFHPPIHPSPPQPPLHPSTHPPTPLSSLISSPLLSDLALVMTIIVVLLILEQMMHDTGRGLRQKEFEKRI